MLCIENDPGHLTMAASRYNVALADGAMTSQFGLTFEVETRRNPRVTK
jgi:hypothetical protein